jgi:hypothetical protein
LGEEMAGLVRLWLVELDEEPLGLVLPWLVESGEEWHWWVPVIPGQWG